MSTTKRAPLPEVWMVLTDRRKLAKLMLIQGVSQRDVAEAAGWRSHSYLGRLLRGEVTTLDVDPAVRIAVYLGVPTDELFVPRVSSDARRNVRRRPARRVAVA